MHIVSLIIILIFSFKILTSSCSFHFSEKQSLHYLLILYENNSWRGMWYYFHEYQNSLHFLHIGTIMIPASFTNISVRNVSCELLHFWHLSIMEISHHTNVISPLMWIIDSIKVNNFSLKIIISFSYGGVTMLSCMRKNVHSLNW